LDKREQIANEEVLNQAIVIKLSFGVLDLPVLRNLLLKIIGIKGHCVLGLLAQRQILMRCDQY